MLSFLGKATVFYWAVWLLTKIATTWGSLYHPEFINGWYDANHWLITLIPGYGEQIRALMRDNVADGTIAFWEVWFGLGLLLGLVALPFRATKKRRL